MPHLKKLILTDRASKIFYYFSYIASRHNSTGTILLEYFVSFFQTLLRIKVELFNFVKKLFHSNSELNLYFVLAKLKIWQNIKSSNINIQVIIEGIFLKFLSLIH